MNTELKKMFLNKQVVAIGLLCGILNYLSTAVDFSIIVFDELVIGPWEIFNTMAAAIGGPLALIISQFGFDLALYKYTGVPVYGAEAINFSIATNLAHIISLLVVAFVYRFLYWRYQKKGAFLIGGWILNIAAYYFITILPLLVILYNWFLPGTDATYVAYVAGTWPEFAVTAAVTTLMLLALPTKFQKPLWSEEKRGEISASE